MTSIPQWWGVAFMCWFCNQVETDSTFLLTLWVALSESSVSLVLVKFMRTTVFPVERCKLTLQLIKCVSWHANCPAWTCISKWTWMPANNQSWSFLPVLMVGVRRACSLQLWQSRCLTCSVPQQKGRQGLTFGNGDLTAQVTVLLQLIKSHFLQPGPLQFWETLDGDWPQPHAAARHAVPGEITL